MAPYNSYVVRTALVTLEDGVAPEVVQKLLTNHGVQHVTYVGGGQKAWQTLLGAPFDLIVMGWRLQELSGLALFNRVRQIRQYQATPILVVSQHVKPEEFQLLAEFPCGRLLTESLTKGYFAGFFSNVVEEASWYLSNGALIESLIDFAEKDASQALALLRTPLARAPNPAPLALLMARKLRENGFHVEAERVLRDYLAKHPDGVAALSELGKVLHLKGDYGAAAELLDRAHGLSPKNVARLCLLGEIDLTLANPNGALSRFARVLEIDVANPTSKAGVQIIKDQAGKLGKGFGSVSTTHALAGMLNIAAIGSIRKRKFDEGIEAYNAALNLASERDARVKLCFNLGLGFFRWGKLDKALDWFRLSGDLAEGQYEKANRYAAIIEERRRGLESGTIDFGTNVSDPFVEIEEERLFT